VLLLIISSPELVPSFSTYITGMRKIDPFHFIDMDEMRTRTQKTSAALKSSKESAIQPGITGGSPCYSRDEFRALIDR
jgi:hypothetical protein